MKNWKKESFSNRAESIIALAEEDKSTYFVLADPKEADEIVRTGKDTKALFKGTVKDAEDYAKSKLSGKDTVMLQRDSQGKFKYTVGSESVSNKTKTGGCDMNRAKGLQELIEKVSQNEMYALGADHIVNWMKKAAYERFDIDPSTISVVPWPQDGSDFNINTPLTKEQYEELLKKMTRTYPLYVVEFVEPGVIKFYSRRTVGTKPVNTEDIFPRKEIL